MSSTLGVAAFRWVEWLGAALLCLAAGVVSAAPGERFLVIGASDASPAAIAKTAQAMTEGSADGPGLIVSSSDCGERRRVFAWAASVAKTADEAQAVLTRLKARVPDAYVKRCQPRPGSLLALGLPAVDASIASVPPTAVNWSDADRINTVVPLGAGQHLALMRQHVATPDDPLEGRRTRVLLVKPGSEPLKLLDDCSGAAAATLARGWLALACDSEQAADHVLHRVQVFSTSSGEPAATVERCRRPRITAPATLQCQGEEVDAQGRLKLVPKTVPLKRP